MSNLLARTIIKRPEPPAVYDLTEESYHQHNRYFNQAEKVFDEITEIVKEYLNGESKGAIADAGIATGALWKIHDMIAGKVTID